METPHRIVIALLSTVLLFSRRLSGGGGGIEYWQTLVREIQKDVEKIRIGERMDPYNYYQLAVAHTHTRSNRFNDSEGRVLSDLFRSN